MIWIHMKYNHKHFRRPHLGKMVQFEPQQPIFLFQYQTPKEIVNDPPQFGHWCNPGIGCFLFLPSIRQSVNLKQDFGEAFHLRFIVTSLRKTHRLALERHPSLPVSWVEQTCLGVYWYDENAVMFAYFGRTEFPPPKKKQNTLSGQQCSRQCFAHTGCAACRIKNYSKSLQYLSISSWSTAACLLKSIISSWVWTPVGEDMCTQTLVTWK